MFKSAVPILLVLVVVIGFLAWANPDFHQKMAHYVSQTNSGMNAMISAGARALSGAGAQIRASFRPHGQSNTSTKHSAPAATAIGTFFKNLGQQIARLWTALMAWFKSVFHLSAVAWRRS